MKRQTLTSDDCVFAASFVEQHGFYSILCYSVSQHFLGIYRLQCSIKMKAGEKPLGQPWPKYEVNQVGNWRATLPHSHHTLEEKDWHSSWNSDGRKQCPEKKHHLVRLAWHPTCHSRLFPMVYHVSTAELRTWTDDRGVSEPRFQLPAAIVFRFSRGAFLLVE